MSTPLANHPYAQARIRRDYTADGKCAEILTSYNTDVAAVMNGVFFCFGLWSNTTRRHIGEFAKEFGFSYTIAKNCAEHRAFYNPFTDLYYGSTVRPVHLNEHVYAEELLKAIEEAAK